MSRMPRIMIVDDNAENLGLLKGILAAYGYDVVTLPNGEMALKAAALRAPDLVLLDINMPGLSGYDVCERLKADERLSSIPVIFLSALTETVDKIKAFEKGGVDYVTKPFHAAEVLARVQTHLKIHELQQALRDQLDRLKELESLRENLTEMIVHDLRSPLQVICLGVDTLVDDPALPPKFATRLQSMDRASRDMMIMISDLLDVTRLEEGKMPLHAAKGDLCLTLREVVADVGPLAAHHDFQFQCEPQECMAVYDESILRRVVKNLVGNALKFTPSGRLVRLELESAGDQVRVTVRDSGPGIPEASQPRVFDKFWQAQGRQEGQKHSTGLGLTFCKLAVEAMGGRITVASREGEGSAFSFTLPL